MKSLAHKNFRQLLYLGMRDLFVLKEISSSSSVCYLLFCKIAKNNNKKTNWFCFYFCCCWNLISIVNHNTRYFFLFLWFFSLGLRSVLRSSYRCYSIIFITSQCYIWRDWDVHLYFFFFHPLPPLFGTWAIVFVVYVNYFQTKLLQGNVWKMKTDRSTAASAASAIRNEIEIIDLFIIKINVRIWLLGTKVSVSYFCMAALYFSFCSQYPNLLNYKQSQNKKKKSKINTKFNFSLGP